VTADVMAAESVEASTATFNGSDRPPSDLAAGTRLETDGEGQLRHEFPARSISLLRWEP
jgi:hypothetical protein